MNQTRLQSLVETCINTAIGFVGSYALGQFIYWLYDIPISPALNVMFTLYFTVWSIARGYMIRRWANAYLHRLAERITKSLQ